MHSNSLGKTGQYTRTNCINFFNKTYQKNLCSLAQQIGLFYLMNLNAHKQFGSSSKCQISLFCATSSICLSPSGGELGAPKIAIFEILLHIETGNIWSPIAPLLGEIRHMQPPTFLYEIESWTTFIWNLVWYNAYFWQHRALKWIHFAIFVHFSISKMTILGGPQLHSCQRYHMRPMSFLYKTESWTTFI